ncbi:hypothetical protein SCG7109_AJ_00070 [Chlamydiales bacterium SCGC AG-110-M15]|nr:hypothetical protein SCG7109_AJ_00070 [Chlamydiales bacterium SCGC AG-110-M15]
MYNSDLSSSFSPSSPAPSPSPSDSSLSSFSRSSTPLSPLAREFEPQTSPAIEISGFQKEMEDKEQSERAEQILHGEQLCLPLHSERLPVYEQSLALPVKYDVSELIQYINSKLASSSIRVTGVKIQGSSVYHIIDDAPHEDVDVKFQVERINDENPLKAHHRLQTIITSFLKSKIKGAFPFRLIEPTYLPKSDGCQGNKLPSEDSPSDWCSYELGSVGVSFYFHRSRLNTSRANGLYYDCVTNKFGCHDVDKGADEEGFNAAMQDYESRTYVIEKPEQIRKFCLRISLMMTRGWKISDVDKKVAIQNLIATYSPNKENPKQRVRSLTKDYARHIDSHYSNNPNGVLFDFFNLLQLIEEIDDPELRARLIKESSLAISANDHLADEVRQVFRGLYASPDAAFMIQNWFKGHLYLNWKAGNPSVKALDFDFAKNELREQFSLTSGSRTSYLRTSVNFDRLNVNYLQSCEQVEKLLSPERLEALKTLTIALKLLPDEEPEDMRHICERLLEVHLSPQDPLQAYPLVQTLKYLCAGNHSLLTEETKLLIRLRRRFNAQSSTSLNVALHEVIREEFQGRPNIPARLLKRCFQHYHKQAQNCKSASHRKDLKTLIFLLKKAENAEDYTEEVTQLIEAMISSHTLAGSLHANDDLLYFLNNLLDYKLLSNKSSLHIILLISRQANLKDALGYFNLLDRICALNTLDAPSPEMVLELSEVLNKLLVDLNGSQLNTFLPFAQHLFNHYFHLENPAEIALWSPLIKDLGAFVKRDVSAAKFRKNLFTQVKQQIFDAAVKFSKEQLSPNLDFIITTISLLQTLSPNNEAHNHFIKNTEFMPIQHWVDHPKFNFFQYAYGLYFIHPKESAKLLSLFGTTPHDINLRMVKGLFQKSDSIHDDSVQNIVASAFQFCENEQHSEDCWNIIYDLCLNPKIRKTYGRQLQIHMLKIIFNTSSKDTPRQALKTVQTLMYYHQLFGDFRALSPLKPAKLDRESIEYNILVDKLVINLGPHLKQLFNPNLSKYFTFIPSSNSSILFSSLIPVMLEGNRVDNRDLRLNIYQACQYGLDASSAKLIKEHLLSRKYMLPANLEQRTVEVELIGSVAHSHPNQSDFIRHMHKVLLDNGMNNKEYWGGNVCVRRPELLVHSSYLLIRSPFVDTKRMALFNLIYLTKALKKCRHRASQDKIRQSIHSMLVLHMNNLGRINDGENLQFMQNQYLPFLINEFIKPGNLISLNIPDSVKLLIPLNDYCMGLDKWIRTQIENEITQSPNGKPSNNLLEWKKMIADLNRSNTDLIKALLKSYNNDNNGEEVDEGNIKALNRLLTCQSKFWTSTYPLTSCLFITEAWVKQLCCFPDQVEIVIKNFLNSCPFDDVSKKKIFEFFMASIIPSIPDLEDGINYRCELREWLDGEYLEIEPKEELEEIAKAPAEAAAESKQDNAKDEGEQTKSSTKVEKSKGSKNKRKNRKKKKKKNKSKINY